MSTVQIDDYECPYCNKITMADLDMRTGKYTCLRCLNGKSKKKIRMRRVLLKVYTNGRENKEKMPKGLTAWEREVWREMY